VKRSRVRKGREAWWVEFVRSLKVHDGNLEEVVEEWKMGEVRSERESRVEKFGSREELEGKSRVVGTRFEGMR